MNWQLFITSAVGLLVTIAMAVVGYFISQLNKRLDKHDEQDDSRFEKLTLKVDAIKGNELLYEKLDAMKTDNTDKRHALRAEMRESSMLTYERLEKAESRLHAEIARIEARIK